MEDKNKQLEAEQVDVRVGSGSLLASARKKQNKTVEEIAGELNLSVSQIKTIELDQSEGLPEPTYVRGYIRSYAKLLGLDAEKILESYLNPNWQKSSSLDDMPKGIATSDTNNLGGKSSSAKVIIVLVFLSVLAFLWFSGLLNDFLGLKSNSTLTPASQTETLVPDVNSVGAESQPVADSGNALNPTETDSAVLASGVDKTSEPAVISNNLTLTFSQTSWVDIRDSDDKRLAYKSYSAGEELNVSSDQRLNVFLGNAEGVNATYNGQAYDISPYREGVYAKFTLGKK